ncbi:MAG TPA: OmpH family outer membrane protein, partial [Verrucomicrobiae bacterium]|nr:OmpH family outer membrane protein [Verrucomicrobiae bacterium]
MKNRLKHLICGACLLAFLSAPAMAQQRIATIDVQKAFDNYWKKKEAEATLKDQQADMQKDLKQMVDDIKKETDAYQKLVSDASDPAVTSEERDRRKKLAEDKLRDLQDLKDRASTYNRTA